MPPPWQGLFVSGKRGIRSTLQCHPGREVLFSRGEFILLKVLASGLELKACVFVI